MKVLRVAILALGGLLAAPGSAGACTIAAGDPRDALRGARSAVYGEILSARRSGSSTTNVGEDVRYRLRVERTFKGRVPEVIELIANTDEASCGAGVLKVGRRYGLLLDGRRRPYRIGLASFMSLADLRRASAGFERPTSGGPIAVIVKGEFGEASLVALDPEGRLLGYGFGAAGGPLAPCPGDRRLLAGAAVVRLEDLRVVGRRSLSGFPEALRCLDPAAKRFVALSVDRGRDGDAVRSSRLLVASGGPPAVVYRGRAEEAVLGETSAVLLERRTVLAVDYASGAVRRLADVPRGSGALAVSPDGTKLAVVVEQLSATAGEPDPTQVLTVDLASGRREVTQLRSSNIVGHLFWLDDQRVTFVSGGGDAEDTITYGPGLARLAAFPGAGHRHAAVSGGTLWGIDFGAGLHRSTVPGGPERRLRELPHTEAGPFALVEQGPAFRGARRVPRAGR